LAGERIDVVRWDENPVQYIVESLKPAKVSKVVADEEATSMDVTVEEDNLAIAIGRGGQNVRLATELTGWQINIMTADEANEKHEAEIGEARGEFMAELDMDQEAATALVECGIYSLEELAYVPEQEIIDLGIFDAETVVELRERARNALLARALQREENLRQADASLLALEGMDNDLASKLVSADVKTADDLGDLDVEELMEKTGLEEEAAKQLIMAARATWTE
jgi:N utilization substance protein A